ncbi:MAG TPA: hypothetical protein VK988_16360 [Acidimicrobiales bacterium]|nr:hypothetical protein [Acidimicrobiales bacterium]
MRVSRDTRDYLRQLADNDGVTLDEEVTRLVRAERQRRIGQALAINRPDAEERSWLEMGADVIAGNAGG